MDKEVLDSLKKIWQGLPSYSKTFFIALFVIFLLSFILFLLNFSDGFKEYMSM